MAERKIREVINRFIKLYEHDPKRWKNERLSHYDFYKLLFDFFEPNEIRDSFKWEYPVGVPSYGTGSKEAAVDIVFFIDAKKWIGIEIELVEAGELKNELIKCVEKLKTAPRSKSEMSMGFIIPLIERKKNKTARGYGKSYEILCNDAINDAKNKIRDAPIEIITEGVLLS